MSRRLGAMILMVVVTGATSAADIPKLIRTIKSVGPDAAGNVEAVGAGATQPIARD